MTTESTPPLTAKSVGPFWGKSCFLKTNERKAFNMWVLRSFAESMSVGCLSKATTGREYDHKRRQVILV